MDLYAENILDHSKSPRNRGTGQGASMTGTEDNPSCGDTLTVHVWLDGDKIRQIEWEGEGCAISQAGMSMLSEELIGKNVNDVLALKKDNIYQMLGVPIGLRRFKCALLCLHTIKNALLKHAGKEGQSWLETVESA